MGKRGSKPGRLAGESAIAAGLRDAFECAERVFWCNTNRDGTQAQPLALENQMHSRGFAAAWIPFAYPEHMNRVRAGDMIVMYATRQGVIAIGRAMHGVTVLGARDPDRIRAFKYGRHDEEWRIPVEWCVWNENASLTMRPLRTSFLEITGHDKLLKRIREHWAKVS
jgi:hypothetical protein